MNRKLTASLLVLAAVLATIGFAALGSIFNYPDVLDEPAGKVLASFRDSQGAVSAWFVVLAIAGRAARSDRHGRRSTLDRAGDARRGPDRDHGRGRAGDRAAAVADPRSRLRVGRREQQRRSRELGAAIRSRRSATSSAPRSARRSAIC